MGKKNIGGAVLDDLKALPKKILKPYYKNGKLNANKVAIDGIPFVIIFYVINKYVQAVVSADGGDMLDKCVKAFSLIFQVKPYFVPSFKLTPLICGIGAGVAFKLFMNSRKKNAKLKMFYTARRKLTEEFPDGKVDMGKLSKEYDTAEIIRPTSPYRTSTGKSAGKENRRSLRKPAAPSLPYGTRQTAISMQICRKEQRPCLLRNGNRNMLTSKHKGTAIIPN